MSKNRQKRDAGSDLRNLEEFEDYLGEAAGLYSDGELRQLQQEMFTMAELLLDFYLMRHRKQEKNKGGNGRHHFDTAGHRDYDHNSNPA